MAARRKVISDKLAAAERLKEQSNARQAAYIAPREENMSQANQDKQTNCSESMQGGVRPQTKTAIRPTASSKNFPLPRKKKCTQGSGTLGR